MPLRTLLSFILRNEDLLQKFSEFYPVKRAAQLTAFWIYRGNEVVEKVADTLKESKKLRDGTGDQSLRYDAFKRTFLNEVRKGFIEMRNEEREKQIKNILEVQKEQRESQKKAR